MSTPAAWPRRANSRGSGLRADDVPDIEIAALAIEHGLVLASHDHGFRRFSRLRVIDPLIGGSA
jgi:predicted nucleic acid-binding protein